MTSYIGANGDLRPPRASHERQLLAIGKPVAAASQAPCSAPLAPGHVQSERTIEVSNLMSAGGMAYPEAVALTHELVEALTATGNYLMAATRILGIEPRPPGDTLGEVLERSLTQFDRAVEAVRHLRAAIGPERPCDNNKP